MSILLQFLPSWIFYIMLFGGIIGTVVVIMFGMFIPLQYKMGIQVGSAMALALGPFFIGAISTEERWQLEVIKQKAEIARLQAEAEIATTKVITKYIEKKIYIKEKGHEIIKQVPIYVTKKADDNCTITNGVVELLNSAAKNEVPDSTGVVNAETRKDGTHSNKK